MVLCEPFKLKHAHKSMDYVKKRKAEHVPEQVLEKEKFFQIQNKAKHNGNHRGGFHGFRLLMRCVICGKRRHVANFCRTQLPDMTEQFDSFEPIQLAVHSDQMSRLLSYLSKVYEWYVPYCAYATLCTTQGVRCTVVFLRDSGSL